MSGSITYGAALRVATRNDELPDAQSRVVFDAQSSRISVTTGARCLGSWPILVKMSSTAAGSGRFTGGCVLLRDVPSPKPAKSPNSVRWRTATVSSNVRQKQVLIARRTVHHCTSLVRRETDKE
jgi:hypothetical protein